MIEQHSTVLQQEQRQSLEKEMQELEKRALAELQRVKSLEESEKRFQDDAKQKYESLITKLEQSWKLEITNREKQLEERFKEHYDSLLAAKDEQLALAVTVNQSVDQAERDRWAYALETLQNKHNTVFNDLEEKMQVKYEGMLQEYERLYQKQFEQYEAHHVQQYLSLEHNRRVQQKKIARFKIAMAKWKFDYQTHMHEKYEQVFADMQSRYLQEVEGRMKDQSSKQEHMAKINLQLKEPNFVPKGFESFKPTEPFKPTSEHKLPSNINPEKNQHLSVLKATIQKLWENLGTDSSEITTFLKVVHTAAPDSDALLKIYTHEASRLNARLPLMQRITRREFLKYRLESLQRVNPADPQIRVTDDRDKLGAELRSVSDQLRKELPEYEQTYHEKFVYRNAPYADTLAREG